MNFNDLRANNRIVAPGLIALGAIFLASRLFNIDIAAQLWPLFVIVPGLPFLYMAIRGGKALTMFIFPGLIITGTGLLLLYQNTFNAFESWAYMWAIYPILVGYGLRFQGRRAKDGDQTRAGNALIVGGAAMLIAFGFLFEFVIFNSLLGGLTGLLIPLLMIAGGGFLMYRRGDLPVLDSLRPSRGDAAEKPVTQPKNEQAAAESAAETLPEAAGDTDSAPAAAAPDDVTAQLAERRRRSDRDASQPFPWENDWADSDDSPDESAPAQPTRRRLSADEDASLDPDLQRRIQAALSGDDEDSESAQG